MKACNDVNADQAEFHMLTRIQIAIKFLKKEFRVQFLGVRIFKHIPI